MPAVTRILTVFIACILAYPAAGQDVVERTADEAVAMMPIPGGIAIIEGETEARVARRLISERTDATPDIQEGDRIIYLDGTRIESAGQFRALFDAIPVDAEVKLGIQRGEEKMIRSFVKPAMQSSYTSNDGGRVMRFQMAGPGRPEMEGLANRAFWAAGFVVGEKDGHVVIGGSMDIPGKADVLAGVAAGDVIVSLNGVDITSADQLTRTYDAIAVGDDVTLVVEGKDPMLFKKPEPPQIKMRFDQN